MAAKGAFMEKTEEDSASSDESMKGVPDFSAEEREFSSELLRKSNRFIKRFDKHQPELQQIIEDLEKSSDEFLSKYETATHVSKVGGAVGAVGGLGGFGAALLLSSVTAGLPLVLLGAAVALGGGGTRFIGNKNKQEHEKKAVDKVENALKKFNKTTDRVSRRLKNICNDIEKILQYQSDEQSRSLKREIQRLKTSAEDLAELAKLFTAEDLRGLLQQGSLTQILQTNVGIFIATLLSICFINVFEDGKTLRDFDKLKRRRTVREEELESKAGKFICKMRETMNQLQNNLNELRTSKSEVERVIIPNLNQYVKQQRETCKQAESD